MLLVEDVPQLHLNFQVFASSEGLVWVGFFFWCLWNGWNEGSSHCRPLLEHVLCCRHPFPVWIKDATSERASSPSPSLDMFTVLLACRSFPLEAVSRTILADQYLPLAFSVLTAHEQAELELSPDEARMCNRYGRRELAETSVSA